MTKGRKPLATTVKTKAVTTATAVAATACEPSNSAKPGLAGEKLPVPVEFVPPASGVRSTGLSTCPRTCEQAEKKKKIPREWVRHLANRE